MQDLAVIVIPSVLTMATEDIVIPILSTLRAR